MASELTVIIPTYNEYDNVRQIVSILNSTLQNINYDILFVDDDSPDGTADLVEEMSAKYLHIKCLKRKGIRGRTSACIDGMQLSSSPYLCVMDADLQHDESILPEMLSTMKKNDLDLVIGSRHIGSGSTGNLPLHRVFISKVARILGNLILKNPVYDPTSGYFMIKRNFFEDSLPRLSGKGLHGFEILLDILASTQESIKYVELPYTMRERKKGQSKLNSLVVWEFISLLAHKIMSNR